MNTNDLIQEASYALVKSWKNINWEYINSIEDPLDRKKSVTNYLKKSIKGLVFKPAAKIVPNITPIITNIP